MNASYASIASIFAPHNIAMMNEDDVAGEIVRPLSCALGYTQGNPEAKERRQEKEKPKATSLTTHPIFWALIAAAAFYFPLFAEGANSACGAAEKRVIANERRSSPNTGDEVFSDLAASISVGRVLEEAVRIRYPQIPPALVCTYKYWQLHYPRTNLCTPSFGRCAPHSHGSS